MADIGETTNVAKDYPEIVKRLHSAYDAHLAEIKANKRPTAKMVRPQGAKTSARPGQPKKKTKK